jgi:urease gamma subunit
MLSSRGFRLTRWPGRARRDLHLTPREIDHLQLSQAGFLAQRRLARGVKLNSPEAIALISTQLMERIRDGYRVQDLMLLGQKMLGRNHVLPGVESMVESVQIEV